MTIVAMWCRHENDSLIGIGKRIPWNVASDSRHFLQVVAGQTVVCGRKTYESFPGRTIDGCFIWVLTADENYELSDAARHRIIHTQRDIAALLDKEERDLYIAGGAQIYKLFMSGKEKLKPHIVVDCVYGGELKKLDGEKIDITDSVDVLKREYIRISPFYEADGVRSAVWVRRGEFVEQAPLKRIVAILESDTTTDWG